MKTFPLGLRHLVLKKMKGIKECTSMNYNYFKHVSFTISHTSNNVPLLQNLLLWS